MLKGLVFFEIKDALFLTGTQSAFLFLFGAGEPFKTINNQIHNCSQYKCCKHVEHGMLLYQYS